MELCKIFLQYVMTNIDTEWKNIAIHAIYPGKFRPVEKSTIFRKRVDMNILIRLISFLESPGNCKKYAFGEKILSLMDGTDIATLPNMDCDCKLKALTRNFLEELYADMDVIISEDERCTSLEKDTSRRCRKKRGHRGKHSFSTKGLVGKSTIDMLIKTLTGKDIKSLAGLDDVKVMKGIESFIKLVEFAKRYNLEELIPKIKDVEVFHQT